MIMSLKMTCDIHMELKLWQLAGNSTITKHMYIPNRSSVAYMQVAIPGAPKKEGVLFKVFAHHQ